MICCERTFCWFLYTFTRLSCNRAYVQLPNALIFLFFKLWIVKILSPHSKFAVSWLSPISFLYTAIDQVGSGIPNFVFNLIQVSEKSLLNIRMIYAFDMIYSCVRKYPYIMSLVHCGSWTRPGSQVQDATIVNLTILTTVWRVDILSKKKKSTRTKFFVSSQTPPPAPTVI